MTKTNKPLTNEQRKRLREEIRLESVRRAKSTPAKVTLPRFSWARDNDAGLQEQETNG